MNLCEARKLSWGGWVRSPTVTGQVWVKSRATDWLDEDGKIVAPFLHRN